MSDAPVGETAVPTTRKSKRTLLLLCVLIIAGVGFGVVKALEYAGVIGDSEPDYERLAREYEPPAMTLDDVVETYRKTGLLFQPGVGCILIRGVTEDDEGGGIFDYQVAPGGRARYLMYRGEEFVKGYVVDGKNTWYLTPEGVYDLTGIDDTYLIMSEHAPLFVDAEARGHKVESVGYRGEMGRDGLWVVVTARNGANVEYKMGGPTDPIALVRWTAKSPDGEDWILETTFEGIYGISRGQTITQSQRMTQTVAGETSSMKSRMAWCAVASEVPDEYFTLEALDQNLWDHMPPPANRRPDEGQ